MINTGHVKPNGKIDLWFSGPDEPQSPAPPREVGGHVIPADVARFQSEYHEYEEKKAIYDKWVEAGSQPVQVEMWANDAIRALAADPDHYSLEPPTQPEPEPAPEPAPAPAPAKTETETKEGDQVNG